MTTEETIHATTRRPDDGIFAEVVSAAAEILHTITTSVFGLGSDVRQAVFGSARVTIDWADGSLKNVVTLASNTTSRADTLIHDTSASIEQALLNVIDRGRETGHGAADLAARTAVSFTGRAEPRQAA